MHDVADHQTVRRKIVPLNLPSEIPVAMLHLNNRRAKKIVNIYRLLLRRKKPMESEVKSKNVPY